MTDKIVEPFQGKTFCVITGASRGIGKEIALQLSSVLSTDSQIFITARKEDSLIETRDTILSLNPTLKVHTSACDQSRFDEAAFESVLTTSVDNKKFDHAIIVHNAGTMGDVSKKLSEMTDMKELSQYFDINVSSVISMNSVFLKIFSKENTQRRMVVNISSLCAITAVTGLSIYCTGKASRDMAFKCLAAEEPDTRVLNYAPGPVGTDMQTEMRQGLVDAETKQALTSVHEGNKLVKIEDTIKKLVSLLREDKYSSGSHIDFYDE